MLTRSKRFMPAVAVLAGLVAAACTSSSANTNPSASGGGTCTPAKTPVITFAAYSTPREVYGKIIPAFQAKWKDEHDGQSVIFQESYGGSTTQAQNVVNGFQADVVALSLAPDVDTIKAAGLITQDWTAVGGADKGIVSSSVAVLDVRPNDPKHLTNWNDLTQSGLQILTPDPAQSGGARWNIVAAYGAEQRNQVPGYTGADGAEKLLQGIFTNVTVLDKSARDSIKNFESGNGDVAITYENEVKTANEAGLPDEAVYPPSTVLIENPVAVVDANAEKHCVTDVATAFVDFLHTQDAKDLYSSVGFLRPVDAAEAAKGDPANGYPAITNLFTVADLGGWDAIDTDVFGPNGAFTKAFAASQG